MTKKSKLSLDDRINLLAAIAKGKNLTQIAKQLIDQDQHSIERLKTYVLASTPIHLFMRRMSA